jgi:chromosome transmission fidelity protein 4
MSVTLYDLGEPARPVRLASEALPLSPGATLDWIGFSDVGVLSTVDSAGVVRQVSPA